MGAFGNVGVDGASARLLKAAQATASADELPKASARLLVGKARAVRLFLEARDIGLALLVCDDIDNLLLSAEDETLKKAMRGHTDEVRKYLGKS